MPYELEFDGENAVEIAGYLLVYPFRFEEGSLMIAPDKAMAFVNMVTGQMQSETFALATSKLPPMCNYAIKNTAGKRILDLQNFCAQVVATPASLDMNRAFWVPTGGRNTTDVSISFQPAMTSFPAFASSKKNRYLWGAEIRDGEEVLLQASLSAPVYDRDIETNGTWVMNYFALGPANGKQNDNSLFGWLTGHGHPPTLDQNGNVKANPGEVLSQITVEDMRRSVVNVFFGSNEIQQIRNAFGAVFVMNGAIARTPWRPLWNFIGDVALGQEPWELAQKLPVSELDQTVAQTAETVDKDQTVFQIGTYDFEGIGLWNMDKREDGVLASPMHF